MASGAFFDPKALLLVTPLISSTCSLWMAFDQDAYLGFFVKPTVPREKANGILPSYIKTMFVPGTARVVSLIAVTTWTSIANLVLSKPLLRSRGSFVWYAWGAAMAAAHLAWIPAVAWKLKWVMDDETAEQGTDNVGMMRRWLNVNLTRGLTTDMAAWACSLVAVLKTLTI